MELFVITHQLIALVFFKGQSSFKKCLQKCVVWGSCCAAPSWNLMICCYQKRDQAIGFSSPSFPRAALPVPAPASVQGALRRGPGTPFLPWPAVSSDRSGGEQEGQRGTQRGVISWRGWCILCCHLKAGWFGCCSVVRATVSAAAGVAASSDFGQLTRQRMSRCTVLRSCLGKVFAGDSGFPLVSCNLLCLAEEGAVWFSTTL